MSERVHGQALNLGQSEVSNLHLESLGDKQILRFEVSVQHSHGVTVSDAEQHLVTEALHLRDGQSVSVNLLAQVPLVLLENQLDFAILGKHLEEFCDVRVV